jgi:hypothetical protein
MVPYLPGTEVPEKKDPICSIQNCPQKPNGFGNHFYGEIVSKNFIFVF